MKTVKAARRLAKGDMLRVRCDDVTLRTKPCIVLEIEPCKKLMLPCKPFMLPCRSPLVEVETPIDHCKFGIECYFNPELVEIDPELWVTQPLAEGMRIKLSIQYTYEVVAEEVAGLG
jgi:hypothetical protein